MNFNQADGVSESHRCIKYANVEHTLHILHILLLLYYIIIIILYILHILAAETQRAANLH